MRRALALVGLLSIASCSDGGAPRWVVWYRPAQMIADRPELTAAEASDAALVGEWDGWQPRRDWTRIEAADGEWRKLELALPSGTYRYALEVGGARLPDPLAPVSAFVDDGDDPYGTEVSVAEIGARRAIAIDEVQAGADGALRVTAHTDGVDAESVRATLHRGGDALAAPQVTVDGGRIVARATGLAPGKYTLALEGGGVRASASAFVEARPGRALSDGLVYQIMVDRFDPPGPPATPGDRAGGTLDGVRAAIERGDFDRLGVSTLWLSPVVQNPTGRHVGRDGRLYEAYHGYWPSQPRTVEPALGGEAALDALVAAAHARGLRVVLDVVPNHVHESHPYYGAHAGGPRTTDWFNDGARACVCGDPGCDWSEKIETCWFGPELPDLNWRNPAVVDAGTGDLDWWMRRFDLDGVRIDAVPMMPRAATRAMVRTVHGVYREGLDRLVLGEVYTGPGDGGRAQIRAYLGSALDGLDGAFDFPLMWALRDVVAHGTSGFDALEREVEASARAWRSSGATMAHMLDNHDTTRFVSEIAGDAGGDPWLAPPAQPTAPDVYARQLIALAFVLTLPGLPVIYYGDEIGLAGGADPDSRRVMPSVLTSQQQALRDAVARLGRLRRCSTALRRSERRVLRADGDHDVTLHGDVLVVLSRATVPAMLDVPMLPVGAYRDALSGASLELRADAPLPVAPLSAAVYLRADDLCGNDEP
jgi:glycosidase